MTMTVFLSVSRQLVINLYSTEGAPVVGSHAVSNDATILLLRPGACLLDLSGRTVHFFGFNYRAMHFSAKRGLAIACRLSVRPSVRLSVLVALDHNVQI